jgi:phospholipase/carboxylesterase
MRTLHFAVLLSVLLLCLPCYAQDQGNPEEPDVSSVTRVLTVDAMVVQPCIVTLPADYSPNKAYPLVIGLHGYGSSAGRFSSNWFAFDNPQFIYACPNAPYPVPGFADQYGWFLLNTGIPEAEEHSRRYAVDYAAAVIAALKAKYNVSQVFVLGFSQGGMLAYQLGVENAGQIAGIACLAAPLEGSWISGKTLMGAAGLPVLVAGGKDDQDVPLKEVQKARDALSAHSLQVEYFEYEGGHTFDAGVLKRVQEWIDGKLAP